MGASSHESLAGLVAFKLLEVVDEHLGELVSLFGPLCGVSVGVAGVEDVVVNAGKSGRNLKVEDSHLLGRGGED